MIYSLDVSYLEFFILILVLIILILVILLFWTNYKSEIRARNLFSKWKQEEFERIYTWLMREADDRAKIQADTLFHEWQIKEEQKIRQDAAKRSHSVMKGKITEQLIPFSLDFPYNPSDARFIGSPVDFVVFDGVSEGTVREVIFIEIKTGLSKLSGRERSIAQAINEGKTSFQIIRKE
ncbi:MAG: Holliday junction resolvase [Methanomicrobiales archaeon]|nr:Holliday junction resolvase [Methanomicrobiales archaeon]